MNAASLPTRGVAAHRGGASAAPENTLAAIERAVRSGAHQIEVDLRRTADGELVVIHDARVDRTTRGRGAVAKLSIAEIRALDAGEHFDRYHAGQRIPLLEEVLGAVPPDRWLNLQIKRGEPIAEAVADAVAAAGRLESVFLACDAEAAVAARAARPEILLCDLDRRRTRADYIANAAQSGAAFIQFHHLRGLPKPEEVAAAHRAGLRVNFFCAPETDLVALFEAGVDFPLVDDVKAALAVGAAFGVHPLGD